MGEVSHALKIGTYTDYKKLQAKGRYYDTELA